MALPKEFDLCEVVTHDRNFKDGLGDVSWDLYIGHMIPNAERVTSSGPQTKEILSHAIYLAALQSFWQRDEAQSVKTLTTLIGTAKESGQFPAIAARIEKAEAEAFQNNRRRRPEDPWPWWHATGYRLLKDAGVNLAAPDPAPPIPKLDLNQATRSSHGTSLSQDGKESRVK